MSVFAPYFELLASIGPIGAVIGGVIVGLALAVIVYAQTSGIFAARRDAKQGGDFQAQLLAAIGLLTQDATAVRAENAMLREEIGRLQTSVALMREQQRRTFDLLLRIMDGSLLPSALTPGDLATDPGGQPA